MSALEQHETVSEDCWRLLFSGHWVSSTQCGLVGPGGGATPSVLRTPMSDGKE